MIKNLLKKKKKISFFSCIDVANFYNEYNEKFLQVYGEIIQAYRTHDVSKLLDYQIRAMQLKPGMKVLDAGCGVYLLDVYLVKEGHCFIYSIFKNNLFNKYD